MDIRMSCEKPGDILYTVKITMTASEWEKLRDQLDTVKDRMSYPAKGISCQIDDLLAQARKIYWPNESLKGNGP